ncbi:MAG: hypothetical protein QGG42_17750 [Phycisphaerae bacterium]|jgi:hypothetical protein|nr:hypothetical protein [Phycisphaerae bacterium]
MERTKKTSTQDVRVRILNFTLVDFLTALVILVGLLLIKPQLDKMLQPAQADSPASRSVKANHAPAPQSPAKSDVLLLARP